MLLTRDQIPPDLEEFFEPAECGECFVCALVDVFREVRRVLRDDGTVWLNLGDSYAAQGGSKEANVYEGKRVSEADWQPARKPSVGLKPKDLIGVPWMVAFALRADGWYLRSDIVWAKKNCMPESVNDRPTRSHEYIFLLTKQARYYYDADAVREEHADSNESRLAALREHGDGATGEWVPGSAQENDPHRSQLDHRGLAGVGTTFGKFNSGGRNKRSVWTVATQPYPGAHFACVDEATDCLTAEGWKRHDELRPGMLAAQFDMGSQTLSWAPIQEVARYDVTDQEMVVGQRRDMSMMLTPNHRCVIQRWHPRTRLRQSPVVVRADEMLPSHAIPTAAPWASGDGDTSLTREWAELLGWYIAEGYEPQQTLAAEIYQSEDANPTKVARIESLLRQVGAEWTTARARGHVAFRIIGYAAVRLRELAPAKRIPPSALLWSEDRIAALMDGLIDGDGHRRADGRMSFIQKDDERAGMVQALALRLGLSAHLTKRTDGINTVYLTKHRTRSFRGTAGYGTPLGRERYTGIVWCPRLPAGTWVARRDGKPFITGNTFPPKLIEPCVLAGSSPKACGVCGAPWQRVVEREGETPREKLKRFGASGYAESQPHNSQGLDYAGDHNNQRAVHTVCWEPSCAHHDDTGKSVVLDPFAGSGTTGAVALEHGRAFIGIELNPKYADLIRERLLGASLRLEGFGAA